MSEKPILFSGPMVRAILDGRKTQTRRVVKLTDSGRVKAVSSRRNWHLDDPDAALACPYGPVGTRLWVRETWRVRGGPEYEYQQHRGAVVYKATGDYSCCDTWHPSIFMPRWASRLTLEVTGIGVERLQEITEEDAIAEGVGLGECTDDPPCYVQGFIDIWDSINAKRGFGWGVNPWVWVVSFRRCE